MNSEFFQTYGYQVFEEIITPEECIEFATKIEPSESLSGGTRSLLTHKWCSALAKDLMQQPVLRTILSPDMIAVQCTYFEKSASRNWFVPFHQDLSIPVLERIDHSELRSWSSKEGGLFVQPPVSLLEKMTAVRIHLDDCSEEEGPLRVISGSHLSGRIKALEDFIGGEEIECVVGIGGALAMKPLLLHASSRSKSVNRRRVLHYLFGPPELPFGLKWRVD